MFLDANDVETPNLASLGFIFIIAGMQGSFRWYLEGSLILMLGLWYLDLAVDRAWLITCLGYCNLLKALVMTLISASRCSGLHNRCALVNKPIKIPFLVFAGCEL